jgi:NADH-quinone oxidoreductase subunit E
MAPSTEDKPSPLEVDVEHVRGIVAARAQERGGVIAVLEAIQDCYGYLPEAALRTVAAETGRSLVDIYGIATFYRSFSLKPRGKHLVCACQGTACHVRGGPRIVEELERQLGISAGQTTADGEFTLETVNCLGACALGPVVVIDGRYHSKLRKFQVRQLLDQVREGRAGCDPEDALALPSLEVACPHCNHGLMDKAVPVDGLPSIRLVASAGTEQGWVRLSSVLGSGAFLAEPAIPPGRVVRLFCPHCGQAFEGEGMCPECESLMASLACRRGGMVRLCVRMGCRGAEYGLA